MIQNRRPLVFLVAGMITLASLLPCSAAFANDDSYCTISDTFIPAYVPPVGPPEPWSRDQLSYVAADGGSGHIGGWYLEQWIWDWGYKPIRQTDTNHRQSFSPLIDQGTLQFSTKTKIVDGTSNVNSWITGTPPVYTCFHLYCYTNTMPKEAYTFIYGTPAGGGGK